MPKKDYRKEIGRFYNKVQEANNQVQDPRDTQQVLNNIADNVGHASTEENNNKVRAMFHAASLLFSAVTPLDMSRQNRVSEPSAGPSSALRQKRHLLGIPTVDSTIVPPASPMTQTAPVRKRKRIKKNETPTPKQFSDLRNEATTISKSQMPTTLPPATSDSKVEQVEQIKQDIINNQVPAIRYAEPVPVFYYDYELFQKRNKTSEVNKKIKAFFVKEGLANPAASESKLVEIAEKWIESLSMSEENASGKAGFLTYLLLQAYGVEDVRLGDFISTVKLQNILMQWKINTFLEDYKYADKLDEKNPQILSFAEHGSIIEFEKYKKESKQLFHEFIHDLPPSILQSQPIDLLFYKRDLWEAREKTKSVNILVEQFLKDHNVSLDKPSSSELVRTMQEWILAGESYSEIKDRETRAAYLIRKGYGIETADEPVGEARLYLLQWENNNAQSGYTYKNPKNLGEINVGEKEQNQDLKQKITDFLQKNDFEQSENGDKKSILLKLDKTQKDNQQKAVIAFLTEKGIAKDISSSQQLAVILARWIERELNSSKTSNNLVNMKQLANLLIGKEENETISLEAAGEIVTTWTMDINVDRTSSLSKAALDEQMQGDMPSETLSTPLAEKQSQWRDPKVMEAVGQLFLQNGKLSQETAKENEILSAVGKWFIQEDGHVVISSDKVQTLAKVILKEMKLYGGRPEEKISNEDAEKTVMKWTFENVLYSSFEEHLAKEILASSDPSNLKISDLRESIERVSDSYLSSNPHNHEYAFKLVWAKLLDKALPDYLYQTNNLVKDPLVSDHRMLAQLAGGKLLENTDSRATFAPSEVRTLGNYFLSTMIGKEKLSPEEMQQLLLPALLATAQLEPELLGESLKKGNYQEVALDTFTSYWRKGYFNVIETQELLEPLLTAYQSAALDWRRKGKLAGEVIQECHRRGVPMEILQAPRIIPGRSILANIGHGINAYDAYLNGHHPCPETGWTPPNLEKWYTDLTKAVADTYLPLDRKLIELAFESMEPKEYEFFSSAGTQIYKASAKLKLKNEEATQPPIHTRNHINFKKTIQKTVWDLENTDLFVARRGDEERIYALKKLGDEAGYKVHCVDRRLAAYLNHELFSVEEDAKVVRPLDSRDFDLSINVDQTSRRHSDKAYHRLLASEISLRNRDKMYDQLYESGNDKSVAEQTVDKVKHFIPFYDCVTESINGNAAEAAPACLLDIISLIPVAGQAIGLGTKFGLGVSKALLRGGLRNALKNSRYFLPKSEELTKLGISTLQYLDPGLELIADSGRLAIKGLTKMKFQYANAAERVVLDKLEKLEKETPAVSEVFKRAHLPGGGPEVLIKRVEGHLYVQVSEKTGNGSGHYFVLKGNQLEVFKEAPSFTKNQQKLIEHLAIEIEKSQQFEDSANLNAKAYGEGIIRKVSNDGESPQLFIKMKDRWIPVRETVVQGKEPTVRYDVCKDKRVFPVNYNGAEWYFEAPTSPFVTKAIVRKVRREFKQFEILKDPRVLSTPDEKGLMRDASGKTYIKINNYYLPLISVDKEAGLYQLVRKNGNEPMSVLKFEPESGRFDLGTSREKARNEQEKGTSKNEKESCEKDLSSFGSMILCGGAISRPRQSGLRNSVSRRSFRKKVKDGIGYNTLPKSPKRGKEWNAIRNVQPYKPERVREEDPLVILPKLTEFIPEQPIITQSNDKKTRNVILEGIEEDIFGFAQPNEEFQVFAGLDPSKVPEFIRPFQKEVADGLKESEEIFRQGKNKLQHLLEQPDIAATAEGRYLTKMFLLKDAPNKEEILKEIAKRLISMAEKGERFLQKTEEFGFENILIVSTELKLDPQLNVYQSKREKEVLSKAFVVPADRECRIIISADAFCQDPAVAPTLQLNQKVSGTVIHEVTHLVSMTKDLALYGVPDKGFCMNGKEARAEYLYGIRKIRDTPDFQSFVNQVAATRQSLSKLSAGAVNFSLYHDDMLRANLQITDAEMVSVIMRDIAEGRAFNAQIRMRRSFGNQRSELGLNLMSLALVSANKVNFITRRDKVREKATLDAKIPDQAKIGGSLGEKREKRSLLSAVQMGKENSKYMVKKKVQPFPIRKKKEMTPQF
ncbi:hypothetical protein D920_02569 [Enterococcus faecalis 13-SD-W-01]|nr:hypothetical protein D920_02569 [Enterococcus faecalis 13-SD-W-01]